MQEKNNNKREKISSLSLAVTYGMQKECKVNDDGKKRKNSAEKIIKIKCYQDTFYLPGIKQKRESERERKFLLISPFPHLSCLIRMRKIK
jgi:hypothetical protein